MKIKVEELVGKTVNDFKILDSEKRGSRNYLLIKCPYCGKEVWKRSDSIISGSIKSCGCYNRNFNHFKAKDVTNKRFGRLVAIKPTNKKDLNNATIWFCKCDCGNTIEVSISLLEKGTVKSCGCLGKENSLKNGKMVAKKTLEYCVEDTNIKNLTSKLAKNNTSGIKGVHWDKTRNKWVAQIEFKKKHYFLGRFSKKEDAIKVRKEAEKNMFGNFLKWYEKYKKSGV